MITKNHYNPVINNDPTPMLTSLNLFSLALSMLMMMKKMKSESTISTTLSTLLTIFSMILWWITVSSESKNGKESLNMDKSIKISMILFITSEVMFFFSMFWSYFHYYLSPAMDSSLIWPVESTKMLEYLNTPTLNTMILISSSITVTLAHKMMMLKNKNMFEILKMSTIFLGLSFSWMQMKEYENSFFCLSDSNFGTTLHMTTGFHGLHVLMGSMYLIFSLINSKTMNMSKESLMFELSSWYWHFVDMIWLWVFYSMYYLNA